MPHHAQTHSDTDRARSHTEVVQKENHMAGVKEKRVETKEKPPSSFTLLEHVEKPSTHLFSFAAHL